MDPKQWTRDDEKLFERLLLEFPENTPNRFENIAICLSKPLAEVKYYYEALVHDINLIESGRCPITNYVDGISSQTKHMKKEKKRGKPWTEEEHRLFLVGLEKYSKGDWKNISRKIVRTRNPAQVASHAQKYFLRQEAEKNAKKRSSIHDITLIDHAVNNVTAPQSELDSTMGQPPSDQQVPQNHHHSENYWTSMLNK